MNIGDWPRPAPVIAVGPRRSTAGAAPGRPDTDTMLAPGTLPASCDRGLTAGTLMSEVSRCVTENGTFIWAVAADTPVVTTVSRRLTSSLSEKSAVCVPGVRLTGVALGR